jgi:hypothetical protein
MFWQMLKKGHLQRLVAGALGNFFFKKKSFAARHNSSAGKSSFSSTCEFKRWNWFFLQRTKFQALSLTVLT